MPAVPSWRMVAIAGQRAGKLFTGGRFFLCRDCYSIAYARASDAALNIALGHLVNRWGFDPDATPDQGPETA